MWIWTCKFGVDVTRFKEGALEAPRYAGFSGNFKELARGERLRFLANFTW